MRTTMSLRSEPWDDDLLLNDGVDGVAMMENLLEVEVCPDDGSCHLRMVQNLNTLAIKQY
jgi:hypothetical protein